MVQGHERDDAVLILNFPEGLVILTGCCHAGVVNTMKHARRITGVDRIHAVTGGLHLYDASEEKVAKSVEALQRVDWVFVGHCTGFDAARKLADALGNRSSPIYSGMVVRMPVRGDLPTVLPTSNPVKDKFFRSLA